MLFRSLKEGDQSWKDTYKMVGHIIQHFPEHVPNNYLEYYLFSDLKVAKANPDYTRANEVMDGRVVEIAQMVETIKAGGDIEIESSGHGQYPNKREEEIKVYYKGHELDKKYKMDIVVGNIIVELKSVVKIEAAHRAQLCNYLRLTKKRIGLLINFGEPRLVGERWVYDEPTNECFLVDKEMQRVFDKKYCVLLKSGNE